MGRWEQTPDTSLSATNNISQTAQNRLASSRLTTPVRTALDFLLAQYQNCVDKHTACRPSPVIFKPTRVLDVGSTGDNRVHLCDTRELTIKTPYVALSHCWGKARLIALTRSNITFLKNGVSLDQLPKTFQDAIAVTRRFQHQYIWIDSM